MNRLSSKGVFCLTGFMGCGKSTAGKAMSALTGIKFIDLDEYISLKYGRSVKDIFRSEGEDKFREYELEALKEVIESNEKCILALGGGTLMTKECFDLVRDNSCCVYLKADVKTLSDNLTGNCKDRPMLQTGNQTAADNDRKNLEMRIKSLLSARKDVYESAADYTLVTDGLTIDEIAKRLQEIAGW